MQVLLNLEIDWRHWEELYTTKIVGLPPRQKKWFCMRNLAFWKPVPTMRCESGSVKRGGNEIGCASSESGAQPIDLLSYDGYFRGSRGQVGCHLRSSLESLGWDFERAVSPSTPSSDRCRRGRSGFFCMRAISLLQPPLCWNNFLEHVQQMCMRYRRSSQIGVRG